ncbi:hypothetical protein ACI0FQ_14625, partial [Bacillus velezensis]
YRPAFDCRDRSADRKFVSGRVQPEFIILLGLDETRPLEERALSFSKRYGKKLTVLDAAAYDFSGIDDSVKGYLAPLVLNRVLRSYADALAEARNHPLSQRRYMWKVEY